MVSEVELRPASIQALKRIDHQDRDRMRREIALLGGYPKLPSAKSLQGHPGLRVRVGGYRIIYTAGDNVLVVAAIAPGHRRNADGR